MLAPTDNLGSWEAKLIEEVRAADISNRYSLTGQVVNSSLDSVVFRGAERATGLPVAVKLVPKPVTPGPEADEELKRSLAELRVHAEVPPHPNVLQLLAAEEAPSAFLLVTPFAPDGTLWDLMKYGQTYCEREVRNCATQILAALQHVHDNCGLVHGDMKPQNLLVKKLCDQHILQLCDFGLARRLDAPGGLLKFTGLHGTSGWFAPEQLLEQDFGIGVDVFATGLIIFRMLAGYAPFEPARACVRVPAEFDESCWCHVSDYGRDFVMQLLAFDPARRGSSRAALEHPWVRGPPPPEPTPEQLKRLSAAGPLPSTDVHFCPAGEVPQPPASPPSPVRSFYTAVLGEGLQRALHALPCH